ISGRGHERSPGSSGADTRDWKEFLELYGSESVEGVLTTFEDTIATLRVLARLRDHSSASRVAALPAADALFAAVAGLESRIVTTRANLQLAADLLYADRSVTSVAADVSVAPGPPPELLADSLPAPELVRHFAHSHAMLRHMLENLPKHLPAPSAASLFTVNAEPAAVSTAGPRAELAMRGRAVVGADGRLVTPASSLEELRAPAGGCIEESRMSSTGSNEDAGSVNSGDGKTGKKMTMEIAPITVEEVVC
ncbi:hypothetical protein HK405_014021, partial [Cladochytrium tenue]